MLKSGNEYLESLRDGRIIYIGGERVDDVTAHPGFRNGAMSFARIWDARFHPRYRDLLTYEEDGQRYPMYGQGAKDVFLVPVPGPPGTRHPLVPASVDGV